MKKCGLLFASFFLIVVLFPLANPLAAPYYEGKRITIVVGSEPGGGYDRMARLLARHLPKYIPGRPTIIVENMPGAGSMIVANHLYNIAKPDGLTIGSYIAGLIFAQLLKAEGVKFDVTKYSWIGSAAAEATVLCIRSDLPYKTFEDLRKAKETFALGCSGVSTIDYQFPILLKEYVGLDFKMVIYPSGTASTLAVERKEVDGRASFYNSLKPYIERGLLRPLIRARVSQPTIQSLPVDEDLTTDKMGRTIMAMRSAGDLVARPYVAPPGTPAEIMNILRDAFAKVGQDQELKEESKKLLIAVEYLPTEECLKVLHNIFNQPDEVIKEFGKYIKF